MAIQFIRYGQPRRGGSGSSRSGGRPGSSSGSRPQGGRPSGDRSRSDRPQGGRSFSGGGRPAYHGGSRAGSGRRPFGGNRGGGNRGGGNRGPSRLDVSQFINKTVIHEEAAVFTPEHRFVDFAIEDILKKNIEKKGYVTPSPIQDRAIPHILKGEDVVGIANTGTGKTGAFLIPLIDKVLKNREEKVLIMVPTRELATQIEDEFYGFAGGLPMQAVSVVGGANIARQMGQLRRSPQFVIATPGRLKDLMDRRAIDLRRFSTVVLDEADRMLDMGFIADIKFILSHMNTERHTLFFSATLSRDIEMLIGSFLKNPTRISVSTGINTQSIEQDIIRTDGKNKIDVLHDLLIQPDFGKVLIFGRTKHGVEKLSQLLESRGFRAASIHGNKTQGKRQRALDAFKQSSVSILVATDVAARGIDVNDVSHVINFDVPATYEDYVHRIGRTGRAGKRGKALTFVD